MTDAPPVELAELRAYATVLAAMTHGKPIEEATREAGLDEAEYQALERRVDDALGRAVAASGDGPHPFLIGYERELQEAQARARPAVAETSIDELARALAALGSGTDPRKALEAMGLDVAAVVRAVSHHAPTLARDPALATRFAQLAAGRKKGG